MTQEEIKAIKKGDFFRLCKRFSIAQRRDVMQVMEVCDTIITVKSSIGCMTDSYDSFEKVEDIQAYKAKYVHRSECFEDNRTKHV